MAANSQRRRVGIFLAASISTPPHNFLVYDVPTVAADVRRDLQQRRRGVYEWVPAHPGARLVMRRIKRYESYPAMSTSSMRYKAFETAFAGCDELAGW